MGIFLGLFKRYAKKKSHVPTLHQWGLGEVQNGSNPKPKVLQSLGQNSQIISSLGPESQIVLLHNSIFFHW